MFFAPFGFPEISHLQALPGIMIVVVAVVNSLSSGDCGLHQRGVGENGPTEQWPNMWLIRWYPNYIGIFMSRYHWITNKKTQRSKVSFSSFTFTFFNLSLHNLTLSQLYHDVALFQAVTDSESSAGKIIITTFFCPGPTYQLLWIHHLLRFPLAPPRIT